MTPELDMTEAEQRLMDAARAARGHAHAPYSRFHVGAAVMNAEGEIVSTGCNVESASYGLTICAERNALFAAVSQGVLQGAGENKAKLSAIAISVDMEASPADAMKPEQRMSCGACRQIMQEIMGADAAVLIDGVGRFAVAELLPLPFTLHPTNQASF